MRIATTLMLGVAALICANAPILAQDSGVKPAAAAMPAGAAPNAVPATNTAKTAPATVPGDTDVQEAKNNDGAAAPALDKSNPDDSDSIAATVNDETISDYEVRQRMALYIATSLGNQQLTEEQKNHIRGQILDRLEEEKVELQEAVKKKITVSPPEVDHRINAMLADGHFTMAQLRATLAAAGATEEALRAQWTASIAWQKTVQDEYGDQVNIKPEVIDAEMARYAEGANKPHFHVMEIFLPVDNPEQDAKIKKDAEEIEIQLHQGAPFTMVARQFSQHPTAATGGDMGWVQQGQLAPELDTALMSMTVGMVSAPIRSTGGYYILAMRERQEPLGTKIAAAPTGPTGPAGTLPLARLLFPTGPRPTKTQYDNVMKVAVQISQGLQSCQQLDEMHQKIPGTVFMNLGTVKLADLSPQIQKAMADSKPGEAAEPFLSEAGIELIARCDKRIAVMTAYTMPSRKEVEGQLFESQISALARRYLRDLKRDANIQVRDDSKPDALVR